MMVISDIPWIMLTWLVLVIKRYGRVTCRHRHTGAHVTHAEIDICVFVFFMLLYNLRYFTCRSIYCSLRTQILNLTL